MLAERKGKVITFAQVIDVDSAVTYLNTGGKYVQSLGELFFEMTKGPYSLGNMTVTRTLEGEVLGDTFKEIHLNIYGSEAEERRTGPEARLFLTREVIRDQKFGRKGKLNVTYMITASRAQVGISADISREFMDSAEHVTLLTNLNLEAMSLYERIRAD